MTRSSPRLELPGNRRRSPHADRTGLCVMHVRRGLPNPATRRARGPAAVLTEDCGQLVAALAVAASGGVLLGWDRSTLTRISCDVDSMSEPHEHGILRRSVRPCGACHRRCSRLESLTVLIPGFGKTRSVGLSGRLGWGGLGSLASAAHSRPHDSEVDECADDERAALGNAVHTHGLIRIVLLGRGHRRHVRVVLCTCQTRQSPHAKSF